MIRFEKILITVLAALAICGAAGAQNTEADNLGNSVVRAHEASASCEGAPQTENIYIHYENDKAWPHWNYANNRKAHQQLSATVRRLAHSDDSRTIIIEGAASPIGSEEYNHRLALRRAEVLRHLITKMRGGHHLKIHIISTGEDWATFRSYVEVNYHAKNREAVLAILRTDESNDSKEHALKSLDKGKTWRVLVNDYMALARNAAVIRIVQVADIAPKAPLLKSSIVPIDAEAIVKAKHEPAIMPSDTVVRTTPTNTRKPVVALRSNLLVPALNIGLEVPIGTNWSVGADYYFPWVWPKRDNKDCFELLAWGIEGRYWFGRNRTVFDRLQGHSIGLYGYMGYYDFERNFHGHQGEFVNVGIDYTYAMAVGKKKAVHFEFSLGFGYIYSQARKYTVIEAGAPLISDKITKKVHFFGPTKANISLVVPIFQKVKPNDKRGDE